ncbi:hypothetical protein CFC21_045408 [Triticum aestivum]|uniref:Uncharacterized protein n=2 Tax=Triticum aestivum TaxID=4565 RepID=A0A3B6GLU5_WHEAT|nr:hypothetical protein CFC21_045408 [Triticum aestivum]
MPDSSGATVLDDLPEWLVVEEILVRLPTKDVLRCRAVRKSWRAGTSADKFVLDHHRRQPSLPIIQHLQGIYCLAAAGDQRIRPVLRYTPPCAVLSFRSPDFFVLAVGSDQPRRIQRPEDSGRWFQLVSRYPGHSPVHHHGSLHWALNVDITVFDTVTETFRKMSRPAQLGHMVSLLDMAGDLALYHLTGHGEIDVWVLQDYDAETWSLQYRINFLEMEALPPLNLEVKGIRSVAVINERELLIKHYPDRLLHCDVDGAFLGNVAVTS